MKRLTYRTPGDSGAVVCFVHFYCQFESSIQVEPLLPGQFVEKNRTACLESDVESNVLSTMTINYQWRVEGVSTIRYAESYFSLNVYWKQRQKAATAYL